MFKKVNLIYVKSKQNLLLLFCFTLLAITGCKDGFDEYWKYDQSQEGFLFTKIKEDPRFSTFSKALELSGVGEKINKTGIFTVFAPTNEAFDEYFKTSKYKSLEAIPLDELTRLVNYHIAYFTWYYYDVQKRFVNNERDVYYLNRSAKYLELTVDKTGENTFKVNGTDITIRDFIAENGVIQGIAKVLPVRPNLNTELSENSNYSTFYALTEVLADNRTYDEANSFDRDGDGKIDSAFYKFHPSLGYIGIEAEFDVQAGNSNRGNQFLTTVLAPSNEALNAYLAPILPNFHNRIDSLPEYYVRELLRHHFTSNGAGNLYDYQRLVNPTSPIRTLSGFFIEPGIEADDVVGTAEKRLSNGYLFRINRVLESNRIKSALGRAMTDPELTFFFQALEKTGLFNTYAQSTAANTIFAPTNAAFTAAGINIKKMTLNGMELKAVELSNIVKHHIVKGDQPKSKLAANGNFETVLSLGGKPVSVKVTDNGTKVASNTPNTANVIKFDIKGTPNGYVHKIDAVLMPTPLQ